MWQRISKLGGGIDMLSLDLMASELSTFIYENDELNEISLYELVKDYVNNKWGDILIPNHKGYVIEKAYEIYEKI